MLKKLPPIEKIYEAYSAVADGRVAMGEDSASVTSSDRSKEYTVRWKDGVYSSNDNATYWQGYAGYPVLAVLMLQGKLELDSKAAELFRGINWKKLNEKHRSRYSEAAGEVLDALAGKGADTEAVKESAARVYSQLESLDIELKRGK
jgi:hypothetical protein